MIFFRIVPEYQRLIRFTFGRYDGQARGPGWVWTIPIVHQTRNVDLREQVFDIPPQSCITKDNASVSIDMLIFMRVVEPDLAVLKVERYVDAARGMAITTLRAVVGDLPLDDVLAKRDQINITMQEKLDAVTDRWGVKVNNVEIREILPPREIQDAMSRQMGAERNRRAVVLEADGQREAAITVAEGQKQASILQAEGQKQAQILQAEGKREAQILEAEGYAAALTSINASASTADVNTMGIQYLETLRALAKDPSTKWIIPAQLVQFAESFTQGVARANGQGQ
ncbi:MAG TPA: SPFH domain-containing protein [Dehalococcoidia bacterium]|nr:SPFH domain-containing protein [Dehalococcoidia bacterium]